MSSCTHTFHPIPSIEPNNLPSNTSSSDTHATPLLLPLCVTFEVTPSPNTDDELEHDLDNFIQQQQIVHNVNTLVNNHRLTHTAFPSDNTSGTDTPTRAASILKKRRNLSNRYLQNRPSKKSS